ncbi:reticulophagy regulator 1 [Polymixia lowei]
MAAVTDHRQGQTGGWFSVSCRISSLINWKRPFRTSALFAATNTVFWVLAFSPIQAYSLLALSLAAMVVMVTVVDVALSRSRGAHLWHSMTASWEVIDSGQDSRSGPQFSESFKLFLQETSSFKQQNPGKFCLLVCSLCTFFAVLGRYIPGIVISYILVLGIFLWPLISSHDFGLWLKPVLQKLDFGIGEFLQKVKQNHEKRLLQAETETENIEADLSSLFPKLDSTACKEMSVSDTEVSDVTWTDNGTFNLSEGHTPQTENSEDLDREEAFTGGLPEFPSLDNGLGTNGDDDDDLSIGLPAPPPQPQQLIKSKRAPPASREPADHALELVHQMAGDVIAAAVASAIHERIEAAVCATLGADDPGRSKLLDADRLLPLELAEEESDSEVEDFELLDQSELEQLEGELGLGEKKAQVKEEAEAKPGKSSSGGFFSKLLGRH